MSQFTRHDRGLCWNGSLETGERKTSSDRILDIYFMKRKVPGMSS